MCIRDRGHGDRCERRVERAQRGGLGDGPGARRGGVLPLGQPVDLVVEQEDLDVDAVSYTHLTLPTSDLV